MALLGQVSMPFMAGQSFLLLTPALGEAEAYFPGNISVWEITSL